jgi:hypothetical protein
MLLHANTVIDRCEKISASNGQMKQIGPVRSAMPPHGRHANTAGTIFLLGRRLRSRRGARAKSEVAKFGRTQLRQNSGLPEVKIDARQGIARTRGHVAPARSLC